MRKITCISAVLFAISFLCAPVFAAEPGWVLDQLSNAQGKQHVLITPHAVEITLPRQKYKVFSCAPLWNVIYINGQVGTYLDFKHKDFMGSIFGRMGNQLANDLQMYALPKPETIKENGLEYAVYDYKLKLTQEELARFRVKGSQTGKYAPREIKAKYLRLSDIPKEAKEIVCKVSCVPMSKDLPHNFTCIDGFREQLELLMTTKKRKEKALTITPPNLKTLKKVQTESELFSSGRMNDVFELFGDSDADKGNKKSK